MIDYDRVVADIDLDAIKANAKALIAGMPADTKPLAVVKADAYGHGDGAVAAALKNIAYGFAVASGPEAMALRNNGIKNFILILGYVHESLFAELINADIALTIFDFEMASKLSAAAADCDKPARVHIKLDTGMNRIGIKPGSAGLKELERIASLPNIKLEGIFTHFFASDAPDKSMARNQYKIFTDFIEKSGIDFKYKHCANSAAVIDLPEYDLDMTRMGITLYGLEPSAYVNIKKLGLKQAMRLSSHIAFVKDIKAGESVGYGPIYRADRDMRIATITVGYADGYPRRLGNKGQVLIRGKRADIIGRVCMDQFMVDVSHIKDAKRGDEVVLSGGQEADFISLEELSGMAGDTFNYEMACVIGKRIPRRYFMNGKLVSEKNYFDDIWSLNKIV